MPAVSLKTPGVYIRHVEPEVPRAAGAGIAGFVGQAERGPVNYPQPLSSWGQFLEVFGGFTGYSYLSYAVFGFFLNGGERCCVVRVAHETATPAALDLRDANGALTVRLRAISDGAWGRRVRAAVDRRSTNDIALTELAAAAAAGDTSARFRSTAGMAAQDFVTLIHSDDGFLREERLPLETIDYASRVVTFGRALARSYPAGSPVAGAGFRVRFQFGEGPEAREEVFDNLSFDARNPRYFVRIINGDAALADMVERRKQALSVLVHVEDLFEQSSLDAARPQALAPAALQGGGDGNPDLDARYYTGRSGGAYFRPVAPGAGPAEAQLAGKTRWGLSALESAGEIETIAIPDLILADIRSDVRIDIPPQGIVFAAPPAGAMQFDNLRLGQREMLRHCASMGNRFAILDAPRGAAIGGGTARIEEWPDVFGLLPEAKNAALYYPWVRENPADFEGRDLFVPPCGHVAGVYALTARARGLGKAPANESLRGVAQLEFAVNDAAQELLNPRAVNCLRTFPNRGPQIWGARTLGQDPLWRYVSVRRMYLFIARQIQTTLLPLVFEPNDVRLRQRVVASLTLFLRGLFQAGALAGSKPEEAFFVKCDDEVNPPDAADRGEIATLVGFAPASPAEFILVTVTRTAESVSVREQEG